MFWVDIKYACFGIIAKDGVIIDAPPITAWMVSKTLQAVKPWLLGRGAKVVEIKCL